MNGGHVCSCHVVCLFLLLLLFCRILKRLPLCGRSFSAMELSTELVCTRCEPFQEFMYPKNSKIFQKDTRNIVFIRGGENIGEFSEIQQTLKSFATNCSEIDN
jgi:hypothetical protein